ncbi:MAG: hypothetical protein NZ523_11280 [Elioraea sp.]|nr:hypothetical protein [Elioraea sp.]MDW8443019.1 hypothetical protein [Acetobacteraceae bacterium]
MIANPTQRGPAFEEDDPALETLGSEPRLSVPAAMAAIATVSLIAWAAIGVAVKILFG